MSPRIDRRSFVLSAGFAGLAAAMTTAQTPRLETFTQWLEASRRAREAALQPTLDRIRNLDPSIKAWVQVSPQTPTGEGRLSGIPFGAKDIMETRGLSTEYGSPVYKGRIGTEDAAVIRDLRQRGAVLLGKTQTTAFAYKTPAVTRNPRNIDYTPGGSSAGSAAAVAAGMVPFATGTQTKGSVLRPASYCGVTGFKASYGLIPTDGVLPFAKSLDTLGFFTHTAGDMLELWEALGHPPGSAEDFTLGVPDPMPDVEPAMAAAFQNAISQVRRVGAAVRTIDIAGMLVRLDEAANTVMFYEGAQFHQQRYKEYGSRLDDIADLVRDGLLISVDTYDEARRYIDECKVRMTELFKVTAVMLVPAATGPAPRGLASTGDARMNSPWTALGTPAISIPIPVAAGGLPLGLQLTAEHGQDARLLRTAARMQTVFF